MKEIVNSDNMPCTFSYALKPCPSQPNRAETVPMAGRSMQEPRDVDLYGQLPDGEYQRSDGRLPGPDQRLVCGQRRRRTRPRQRRRWRGKCVLPVVLARQFRRGDLHKGGMSNPEPGILHQPPPGPPGTQPPRDCLQGAPLPPCIADSPSFE